MNRDRNGRTHHGAGVPAGRGGQYAQEARAETALALTHDDLTGLDEALARYGITVDDVPLDTEGVSLAERWAQARALADAPTVPGPAQAIREHLGQPDFGRERGEPTLEWRAATGEWDDWDGPRVGALDPQWDDPDAMLVASMFTRNGGGNRDCWCNSKDDCGCLAGTISALQAHPAYVCDEDDDGDETYATFWFRLDKTDPGLRRAVSDEGLSREQDKARSTLGDITEGREAPWVLMAPNPVQGQRIDQARAELEACPRNALDPKVAHRIGVSVTSRQAWSGGEPIVDVHLSEAHLADTRAFVAFLEDPDGGDPPVHTGKWSTGGSVWNFPLRAERYRDKREEALAARALGESARSGQLDPHVQTVVDEALTGWKYRDAEENLAKARSELEALREPVTAAHRAVRDAIAEDARRSALRVIAQMSDAERCWPGEPGTAPEPTGQPLRAGT